MTVCSFDGQTIKRSSLVLVIMLSVCFKNAEASDQLSYGSPAFLGGTFTGNGQMNLSLALKKIVPQDVKVLFMDVDPNQMTRMNYSKAFVFNILNDFSKTYHFNWELVENKLIIMDRPAQARDGSTRTPSVGVSNSIALGNTLNVSQSNTAYLGPASITSMVSFASYSSVSDRRLKTNITDSLYGLDFINRLKPVEYSLTSNVSRQLGFIAQEVEALDQHYPAIVKPTQANPYYALTYSTFIPTLVKAVQELDLKVQKISSATLATDSEKTKSSQSTPGIVLLVMSVLVLMLMGIINAFTLQKLKALKD
jgi:hypothetical protein